MLISDEYAMEIMRDLDYTETDPDLIRTVKNRAAAVIGYLNNGGARLDTESLSPDELYVIAIGVNDLSNNAAGCTSFSPTFNTLAMQLCAKGDAETQKGAGENG